MLPTLSDFSGRSNCSSSAGPKQRLALLHFQLERPFLLFILIFAIIATASPVNSWATTRYVGKTNASNTGTCTNQAAPCASITYGISQMVGGDTLIVGNGTYTTGNDIIRDPPNGSAGAYTTVRAETDFGVLLDGTSWGNSAWVYGLRLDGRSYIKIQGFRINAAQNDTGGPSFIGNGSHHIKIIKCGFWNGPVDDNGEISGVGDSSGKKTDYILFEDCYAFGGGRAGFTAYWSDHVIFRRCVSRPDYYHFDLQLSGFCNYDSRRTVFQNNIVVNMTGGAATSPSLQVYSPFFFENKNDHEPNTSIEMHGNIAINNSSYYGSIYDQVPADTRVLRDNILWGNSGGFQSSDYVNGETFVAPTYDIQRLTSGENNLPYDHWNNAFDHNGTYSGGDGLAGAGTGMSIILNRTNTVTNSLFYGNQSYGAADYITGNYNSYSGNGANFGGLRKSSSGANDIFAHDAVWSAANNGGSIKWLPKGAEDGSALATGGSGRGRVGAQVMWKIGVDGTLYGETGWNTVRSPENGYGNVGDRLWPWPNEAQIKADMASYSGPGSPGKRGFCTGTSLDGTPQTLTKYIWEQLGNQVPADMYTSGSSNAPPAASINANPTSGQAPLAVSFTGSGTNTDGTTASYSWNFGDGQTSNLQNPTHTYTTPGVYTTTLTVTGNQGATGTASINLTAAAITTGASYYVTPSGSDSSSGSQSTPWRTLQHAADTVGPGDTVYIADGNYAGFYADYGGTEGSPVTFKALGTGVNITSKCSRRQDAINLESWEAVANYITIDGFNIYGMVSSGCGVRVINGTGIIVKNCNIHNNAGNGILTGDAPHFSALNNRVYSNGSSMYEHNIYVSNAGSDYPIIRGNKIYSANYGTGLHINGDYQEGGDGYIDYAMVENNVIHDNAAKGMDFTSCRYSTAQNNVFYNNGGAAAVHVVDQLGSHYSINNLIVNNTMQETNTVCVRINSGSTSNVVFNNICVFSGNGIVFEGSGNYESNNLKVSSVGTLFVNAGTRDYHLTESSSARDAGLSTFSGKSAPVVDLDAKARPSGPAYDIGAYEYVAGGLAPPSNLRTVP